MIKEIEGLRGVVIDFVTCLVTKQEQIEDMIKVTRELEKEKSDITYVLDRLYEEVRVSKSGLVSNKEHQKQIENLTYELLDIDEVLDAAYNYFEDCGIV